MKVSEKHGLNPSLQRCFVCQKDIGVVLFGALPNDAEAPREVCLDTEPCVQCKALMRQGIILISVSAEKTTDPENPYRTGCIAVVKEEAVRRIFAGNSDVLDPMLKHRMGYVDDRVWDTMRLPRLN